MCYQPLYARVYQYYDKDLGEFKNGLKFVKSYEDYDYTLPCCKCAECLTQKSLEWSFRIMLESKDYKRSCFITLTYADNPVSLIKSDYQKFLKRLRKKIGKFRYFLCGEYGSSRKRPHYHAIIFGWFPEDAKQVLNTDYYSSDLLAEIWGKGFVSVGDLSIYDAKYCAKYMQKLQDVGSEVVQPFVAMSLKPGLGFNYFKEHKDALLKSDKIYFEGKYIKLPKYFLSKCLQDDPENYIDDFLALKKFRQLKSDLVPNTEENLNARKLKYKKLDNSKDNWDYRKKRYLEELKNITKDHLLPGTRDKILEELKNIF